MRDARELTAVIIHNSDGRPCGWGLAPTEVDANALAEHQYSIHKCYAGEQRGDTTVHLVARRP
jgi:hypothetical protein